jgi:hypothetical protein
MKLTDPRIRLGLTLLAVASGVFSACADYERGRPGGAGATGGAGGSGSGGMGATSSGAAGIGGASSGTSGTGGKGGASSGEGGTGAAGAGAGTGGTGTGGTGSEDAGSDAPAAAPCAPPAEVEGEATSKLCLSFAPEELQLRSEPELDGRGTLIVEVFDVPEPSGTTAPLYRSVFPPPSDAGAIPLSVYDLPRVDIDGLPEKVYVRSFFIDNPAWFEAKLYTYGLFMGGRDFNNGLIPTPPIREITLPARQATQVTQPMIAFRRFSLDVRLGLPTGTAPGDDAEGQVLIGAFQERSASNTRVFGYGFTGCASLLRDTARVTGFLFSVRGAHDFWFAGQLDDFAKGGFTPPGSLVSVDESLLTPDVQKRFVRAEEYAVTGPAVVLNSVIPGYAGFAPYRCLPEDAGTPSDAAADGSSGN